MTFSRRSGMGQPAGVAPPKNALTRAVARRRASADATSTPRFLDLTVSNPTTASLPYATEEILRAIGSESALVYEPQALGHPAARAAVAADYAAHGHPIPESRIAITASTSEAYAILFKLLCDPGDEVLVPVPSYPLLAWLAAFEGVVLRPYPLVYAGGWHVDIPALARSVDATSKAIVVVAPNNPTGSYLGRDELDRMLDLGLPIVSDEVFARYPLGPLPEGRIDSVLGARRGLVFALSGLSKVVGLPQMKLGWIACGGDPGRADDALERLETLLDAYLSVGAPVQHALSQLLQAGERTAAAIRARTRTNLEQVRTIVRGCPATTLLDVEGGWYAILRVPETRSDEEWATSLVDDEGVHVQPGYFFDLTQGAHLVVSLLTPEPDLTEGMTRIASYLEREATE
jgi:alanine-synthesizing transaminase